MNREQRKYTLERIERIAQEKRDKLNKLVERAEKTRWNDGDLSQFILNGEATIKKYDELVAIIQRPKTDHDLQYRHPSYTDFYDYPGSRLSHQWKTTTTVAPQLTPKLRGSRIHVCSVTPLN